MVAFVILYRRRDEVTDLAKAPSHHTAMEITWTVIPLILVLFIFYFGFKSFMDYKIAPQNSYEILVTGQKWKWFFTYPNGYVDEDLHVPINQPVLLTITQRRNTQFLCPCISYQDGCRTGTVYASLVEPTIEGEFQLFCGILRNGALRYAGTGRGSPSENLKNGWKRHRTWIGCLWRSRRTPLHHSGLKQCHSIDGTAGHGPPSWTSTVWKKNAMVPQFWWVTTTSVNPLSTRMRGLLPVTKRSCRHKGRLKDKEITALIAFLKTLSQYAPSP